MTVYPFLVFNHPAVNKGLSWFINGLSTTNNHNSYRLDDPHSKKYTHQGYTTCRQTQNHASKMGCFPRKIGPWSSIHTYRLMYPWPWDSCTMAWMTQRNIDHLFITTQITITRFNELPQSGDCFYFYF